VDERVACIGYLFRWVVSSRHAPRRLRGHVARDLARLVQAEGASRRLVVALSDGRSRSS
jgi:hypothetical protein